MEAVATSTERPRHEGGGLELRNGAALVNQRLTPAIFDKLGGRVSGFHFVKLIVDRHSGDVHFINHARYAFHAHYIAEQLLGMAPGEVDKEVDDFNRSVYVDANRRFYLGVLGLYRQNDKRFFTLETVEVDRMDAAMLQDLYGAVKKYVDGSLPLLFKPANHLQEAYVGHIDDKILPRVFNRDLFALATYVPLNVGTATGRLRLFKTEADYTKAFPTIEWYDILVMPRVPDDLPRVSGIINARHTTPLSHTNVLAAGWHIPNAIDLGVLERVEAAGLNGEWVTYTVDPNAAQVRIEKTTRPAEAVQPSTALRARIKLEEPETTRAPVVDLGRLRMTDRFRYGTKAANLGELVHLLEHGSTRMLGYYLVRRPPRQNLLPYLAALLGVPESSDLERASWDFLKRTIQVPRGVAIPFAIQEQFLNQSPAIQQAIGKLKMALELNVREIEPLCTSLQALIKTTRFSDGLRDYLDREFGRHLAGVSSFVVRSSSNAEDLANFSAAGIYESVNQVTTAQGLFDSIREVWASLVSPRSLRLQHEAGIPLDYCWMGVVVQEEIQTEMGGVLITTTPKNPRDFRNVYMNASVRSVRHVVDGTELPYELHYNTVEGGGQTLSLGSAHVDLDDDRKALLQRLAIASRLLQAHFSPDYTFSSPVDIEWIANEDGIYVLQLRPYGG